MYEFELDIIIIIIKIIINLWKITLKLNSNATILINTWIVERSFK